MKNNILLMLFLLLGTGLFAQIKIGGDTLITYEYATVSARVTFQTNSVLYDEVGFSKSPMVYLPNGDAFILKNSTIKKGENRFSTVNAILNYMSSEGWRLISSTITQNKFDTQNHAENTIINVENHDQFLQQLIFERQKK